MPHRNGCESFNSSRLTYAKQLADQTYVDNRFADYQDMLIERIEFVRLDVFDTLDPNENNPLYRFVNLLNMRTRESTLKPQLLFKEGQRLDPAAVAETERNLRGRSYLSSAFVMPVAECNGRVHLMVVTKDAWTTQPIVTASREGGSNESKLGLVEGNFLGTGGEVSIVVTKEEARRTVAYKYSKDYVWGKPLGVSFGFSDNSDGYSRQFAFGKPFYTNTTRTAFDVGVNQSKATLAVDQNAYRIAQYDADEEDNSIFAAWRYNATPNNIKRIYAGVTQRKQAFSDYVGAANLVPSEVDDLAYPWLALESKSSDYVVMSNVNYIGSVEDLRVGPFWSANIGYSPGQEAAWIFEGNYEYQAIFKTYLLRFESTLESVKYNAAKGDHFYDAFIYGDYMKLLGDRHRLFTSAYHHRAKTVGLHNAVSLGGALGVRGYPAFYAIGEQATGATFEYRYYSGVHLINIIRLGGVVYVDMATLKDAHYGLENSGYKGELLSSVGVGLRIASSKTHVGNVVHIDLASPTGYQKNASNYQLLLRAERHF